MIAHNLRILVESLNITTDNAEAWADTEIEKEAFLLILKAFNLLKAELDAR